MASSRHCVYSTPRKNSSKIGLDYGRNTVLASYWYEEKADEEQVVSGGKLVRLPPAFEGFFYVTGIARHFFALAIPVVFPPARFGDPTLGGLCDGEKGR